MNAEYGGNSILISKSLPRRLFRTSLIGTSALDLRPVWVTGWVRIQLTTGAARTILISVVAGGESQQPEFIRRGGAESADRLRTETPLYRTHSHQRRRGNVAPRRSEAGCTLDAALPTAAGAAVDSRR